MNNFFKLAQKLGLGGTDWCVCTKCSHKQKHTRGIACNTTKCAKCGAKMMVGAGMPHPLGQGGKKKITKKSFLQKVSQACPGSKIRSGGMGRGLGIGGGQGPVGVPISEKLKNIVSKKTTKAATKIPKVASLDIFAESFSEELRKLGAGELASGMQAAKKRKKYLAMGGALDKPVSADTSAISTIAPKPKVITPPPITTKPKAGKGLGFWGVAKKKFSKFKEHVWPSASL